MIERTTARVVLINQHKEVLFLWRQRAHVAPFWFTPGGEIEYGETPLVAAQRELIEETGIQEACFNESPLWYHESVINFHGTPTLFKEHFFVAHTTAELIADHIDTDEKEHAARMQWWDVQSFIDSGEMFYPEALLSVIAAQVK